MADATDKLNGVAAPERAVIGQAIVSELADISQRRGGDGKTTLNPDQWIKYCLDFNLFGISISGGGIRSATFGLGVLQGLSEKGLLSKADYISTVSGGGYIGSWLQGLARHYPQDYNQVLKPERAPEVSSKDPITFLRKYSNYLAPRNGLSLDALVIPLIWLRNMFLNQAIIISALMAIYISLLAPGALLRQMATEAIPGYVVGALIVLIVAAAAIAVGMIGKNLRQIVQREFGPSTTVADRRTEQHIGSWVAAPLFISALLLVSVLAAKQTLFTAVIGFPVGFLILFALVALLQWGGGFVQCYKKQRKLKNFALLPLLHLLWMPLVTALFLLILMGAVWFLTVNWNPASADGSQFVIAWAAPLYLLAMIVGIGFHIGLMGRDFPDASREWLARIGALLLTFAGLWAALFALSLFAPLGIAKLWLLNKKWLVRSGTVAWLLSTLMSVLAGKSSKSGGLANSSKQSGSAIDLVARYGPLIAIPGFLAAVAFATQLLLHPMPWNAEGTFLENFSNRYWESLPFSASSWLFPFVLLIFLIVVFVVLSSRVNINEFSMHHFYKNRLVRCYMGASNTRKRMPNLFTGFDPNDDIPLSDLRFQKSAAKVERVPYPIINCALTVTAGGELATQERKALPWFFTPHYSGFYPARSEEDRVSRDPAAKESYVDSSILGTGVALGTATGISGAAINPNSGYHSSPQTAFLLTLFNVRLGWWLGNPTKPRAFGKSGPTFALWWLARELFGFVDEGSRFLNLSDGGHFENLGLYELVRRRCRYIIAIDGEEDNTYQFEGLGGAVRKCRTDFGVEIDIDPRAIIPKKSAGRAHCVIGRINYSDTEKGVLLYLKSSITGNEPADVEEYRRKNPEFPQQSTVDQFFSESQFESYRRLGLHVARTAFDHIIPLQLSDDVRPTFERLKAQWLLAPKVPDGVFTRHGEAYADMMKTLSDSPDLKSADTDIVGAFPEWAKNSTPGRHKFFFYMQLLQLIEDVFVDMDFGSAQKWNHPATAGWKGVITYWAGRDDIKGVWEMQRETFGQPFRDCFDDLVRNRPSVGLDEQT